MNLYDCAVPDTKNHQKNHSLDVAKKSMEVSFILWCVKLLFVLAVVLLWPRVGRPCHSFLAQGCGGRALTFAGIMSSIFGYFLDYHADF